MSDIFVEDQDMLNTNMLVSKLREVYLEELKSPNVNIGIDERQRWTKLATNFPDHDLIRQIIYDTCKILVAHNIHPKLVRW